MAKKHPCVRPRVRYSSNNDDDDDGSGDDNEGREDDPDEDVEEGEGDAAEQPEPGAGVLERHAEPEDELEPTTQSKKCYVYCTFTRESPFRTLSLLNTPFD